MRKLISILLILIMALSFCLSLTGCDQPTVSVRSELSIDDSFSGTRIVTAIYPLSVDIDAVKEQFIADAPADEIDGADFTYIGVEEDGYHFRLRLSFKSRDQYEEIVGALIGRTADVFLSCKNTALTQGTRMEENFDTGELISWLATDTAALDAVKHLRFSYDVNTVQIGDAVYDTASTVSVNDCTGSAINTISLKTSNDKEDSYDRTFVFSIPIETYSADRDAIEQYFLTNTLPDARYAGWANEGSNMLYTVIYEDMDLEKMTEVTAKILDTDSVEITYGDIGNASTPLSEGLTFEEKLDAFSFIGPDNGFPVISYAYSLPLNTTYGDGSVFEDGRWVSAGTWQNDLYTVELTDGSACLRIPDGIQYTVTGIDFSLASLGDARFRRTTEFIYERKDSAAAGYALNYFVSKGIENAAIGSREDGSLVCSVVFEGTTDEITADLVKVFGSGNFMSYEQHKGMFDLSIKTELTDYVNLGYMLNAVNTAAPMNYTVGSEGGENIVSVSVDGSETAYTDHSSGTLTVKGGCAVMRYHGNIPVTASIIIYIAAGTVLLALTAFVAIKLLVPRKRRYADPLNNPDEVYETEEPAEDSDAPSAKKVPLSQTTTFSILELNTLVRNKKYVDEINKDVEQRLHAQSLEEQKQDIRARELEEMSRKVYGAGEAGFPSKIDQELTSDGDKGKDNSGSAPAGEAGFPSKNDQELTSDDGKGKDSSGNASAGEADD